MVEPLPAELRMPGSNPDLLAREYIQIVVDAINNSPRTLQKKIGPSEIGTPCARKLAYKFLGHDEINTGPANWKATMGTGAHMWLETAFDRDNLKVAEASGGHERWYIETQVSVGELNGEEITGHCDLYDRVTSSVLDHKTVGPTKLKEYKKTQEPGETYRAQAHLYGRGWVRAGLDVENVFIAFLPRNGGLSDAYIWHEPYDEQIALNALKRAEGVDLTVKIMGLKALDQFEAVDDYCSYCPFFKKGSTDLSIGCPGAEGAVSTPAPALTITPKPSTDQEN